MKREIGIYLAIFVTSYATFLAAYRVGIFSTPFSANVNVRAARIEIIQRGEVVNSYAVPSSIQVNRDLTASPKCNVARPINPLPARPPPPPSVAYEIPAVLNIDYSSPRASEELTRAAHFDESAATRIAAVNALRAMAANGDKNGFLREALRTAASDADESVASTAQAAYQEVSQWDVIR